MFEIRHYITDDGRDVFADWRDKVKDSKAKIAIDRRIYRAALGNFGDHKPCREGVWELRIDVGPGYRVYHAGRENRGPVALRRHQAFAGRQHIEGVCILEGLAAQQGETGERAMKDRAHDDAMAEVFRKDPAYAVELLNSILADGDQGELLIALRQMTKAFGGVSKVAEKAELNGTHIYRTLSAKGNPGIRSLSAILKAMGLRLAVQPIQRPAARA